MYTLYEKSRTHKIAEVRNKKWRHNSDHSEFLCIYVYLYPSRDIPTYTRLSTRQNTCLVWKTVWVDIKEFSENRDYVQGQNELQTVNSLVHLRSWVDRGEGGGRRVFIRRWHVPFQFAVFAYLFFHIFVPISDKTVQPYYSSIYFKSNLYRTGEESRASEVGRLLIIFLWDVLIGFLLERECRRVSANNMFHSEYLGIDRGILLKWVLGWEIVSGCI
jgi:hypothetical protein